MQKSDIAIWRHANIATFNGTQGWGLLEDAALVSRGGFIDWVGPDRELPAGLDHAREYALRGALLTPGLIDAHTHLVYGGDRASEFEARLEGVSYEAISKAGGGIRSTVRATREADERTLYEQAAERARHFMAEGVTTLEIKSGYGLSQEHESRCLAVARRLGRLLALDVKTTSLGAHALPDEYAGRADDYIDAVCQWLGVQQAAGLVDAVDAFCENIAFSPAQVRRVFETARALGLPVKIHAEQLSDQGGAALAAEFGALSCDHLEYLSDAGIAAMKRAGSVAVLLPGAFYFIRETRLPPVKGLLDAGVPIAIASDHNPGTSPTLSLVLMLNMACTFFRLTPEQAWRGVTVNAARALGLADRGRLEPGLRTDLAVWDAEHPRDVVYRFGRNPCIASVHAGLPRA